MEGRNDTLTLHAHPMSGCSRRVLALAGHWRMPVELSLIDLPAGAHRSPDYLRLNPTGRVPTLVEGSTQLWESAAIMRHLARSYATEALGSNPEEQAHVDQWVCWGTIHLAGALAALNAETGLKRMFGGTPDPEEVARRTKAVQAELAIVAGALRDTPFIVGAQPTLADFAIAPSLEACTWLSGLEIEPGPVAEWFDRMRALPGWPADPRG